MTLDYIIPTYFYLYYGHIYDELIQCVNYEMNLFFVYLCNLIHIFLLIMDLFFFSVAVNNVGRMYDYPEELGKLSPELLWSLINVNMSSVTMMTRMLINDMKKRGKGAIVNISSGSELQPLPFAAVYGASKVSGTSFKAFFCIIF